MRRSPVRRVAVGTHRVDVAGWEEDQRRRHLHGGDELVPRCQRRGRLPPFAQGTARTDTGQVDLDATLAYAAAVKPMRPRRSGAPCWSPTPPVADSDRDSDGNPDGVADRRAVAGSVDTLPSTGGGRGVEHGLSADGRIERGRRSP
jgi:hypothetical protein